MSKTYRITVELDIPGYDYDRDEEIVITVDGYISECVASKIANLLWSNRNVAKCEVEEL